MQFCVGDRIVYPAHGVVEVRGIEVLSGTSCYRLQSPDGTRISVPLDKAEERGLRRLLPLSAVGDIHALLKERATLSINPGTWNRRYRGYMEKVRTGDIYEVAEVFRDLGQLRRTKTLSFGERRMYETVRKLLVSELAAVQQAETHVVINQLEALFKEA